MYIHLIYLLNINNVVTLNTPDLNLCYIYNFVNLKKNMFYKYIILMYMNKSYLSKTFRIVTSELSPYHNILIVL